MSLHARISAGIRLIPPGQGDARIQALRARFLIDEKGYYSNPSDLFDEYEPHAGYVCVESGEDKCSALLRIIHPNPAGFRMQRYFRPADHIRIAPKTIEISEFIIDQQHRGSTDSLRLGLGFAGYLKKYQPDMIIGTAVKNTAVHYNRLGVTVRWDVKIFSTAWNVNMWLCYAQSAELVMQRLLENVPRLYRRAVQAYLDSVDPEPFDDTA